ncbi:unnamed protein product [Musa acuminata subsp. burmannicoides]
MNGLLNLPTSSASPSPILFEKASDLEFGGDTSSSSSSKYHRECE